LPTAAIYRRLQSALAVTRLAPLDHPSQSVLSMTHPSDLIDRLKKRELNVAEQWT
jgi:hypothetical protein